MRATEYEADLERFVTRLAGGVPSVNYYHTAESMARAGHPHANPSKGNFSGRI